MTAANLPEPSAEALESSERLKQTIREEIALSDGLIPSEAV